MSKRHRSPKRKKEWKQPPLPSGLAPRNSGPEPDSPKLEFRGNSWKWYYRRKWKSLKLPKEAEAEARRRFQVIEARILSGQEVRERPGELRFKDMIARQLAHMAATAITETELINVEKARTDSVWWLQFFGKMKLVSYRAKHSDLYKKWYVKERKAYYLKHPWSRKQAINGAATSLQALRKFCLDFAEDDNTEWCPNIKVTARVPVPPGRILSRPEQARLLKACMGGVWDRKTGDWKTKSYVDADGKVRKTWRIRPKKLIAMRKGYSRVIRAGIRTAVREEVFAEAVWGRHNTLAHFEVEPDGSGTFRRRGLKVDDSNKSRPPSAVIDRLKVLLRIWQYEDGHTHRMLGPKGRKRKHFRGRKQKHVFRKVDGMPYETVDLAGIVRDAGLGREVTEHALRYTAVDEAHKQKFSLQQAARVVGMSQEMLLGRYTDWSRQEHDTIEESLSGVNSTQAAKLLRRQRAETDDADRKRKRTKKAQTIARKLEREAEAAKKPAERAKPAAADRKRTATKPTRAGGRTTGGRTVTTTRRAA